MRTALIIAMLVPTVVMLCVLPILTLTFRRFHRAVPEIRTESDIQKLRRLAKLQMYLSLMGLPSTTIGIALVVWLVGAFVFKQLGWLDLLLYAVVPIVIVVTIACMGNSPADMSKEIPASDPQLAAQRDHTVDVWINKKLPDW